MTTAWPALILGVSVVAGLGAIVQRPGDDLRLRRYNFAQGQQLLFKQRQRFWHFDDDQTRIDRQRHQAALRGHGVFIKPVQTQVMARRQLAHERVIDAGWIELL